ncbi:hypothetical protein N7512_001976 [Penicillium capsulatum]|nr:hypothetical protein N7512_001976 [Penicillium capsulatum]
MFAPKTSAPATGGLSINVGAANNSPLWVSLFPGRYVTRNPRAPVASPSSKTSSSQFWRVCLVVGGATNTQTSSTTAPGSTGTSGLFGSTSTAAKPGGLFGGGTQQPSTTGSSMFGSGSSLFNKPATTTQPQTSSNLFGATTSAGASTSATGTTGGSMFGGLGGLGSNSAAQTQAPKPAFGGLGGSTLGGGLGGGAQDSQKPTLGVFGDKQVKVDLSNLLPTTKFESCADEIRNEIEGIDNYILNQMKMCQEVSDILPNIEQQGSIIPNDVDYVQEKLNTALVAINNDAADIDQLRNLLTRDEAEAKVAFRAIDSLELPLQYKGSGSAWWSAQDQKVPDRGSFRKNTMALPDEVEQDRSSAALGLPTNMVEYFSHRADEFSGVLDRYKNNIKEIEDHLNGVELNLNRQYHELVISRSREGGASMAKSTLNDLAAVLGDVEAGIVGVAGRLGSVSEQVQEIALGPLPIGEGRLGGF